MNEPVEHVGVADIVEKPDGIDPVAPHGHAGHHGTIHDGIGRVVEKADGMKPPASPARDALTRWYDGK